VFRSRGLFGGRPAPAAVVVIGALAFVVAGCSGGGSDSGKKQAKEHREKPKFLRGGGSRRILHKNGVTLKAVVYGGSGAISTGAFTKKPDPGTHFIAVKVGLRNMGPGVYRRNLVAASAITDTNGGLGHAVSLGSHGLSQVALKKDEITSGRIFFELPDKTRLSTFRFRPFPGSNVSVFTIRGGPQEAGVSTKPLRPGGIRKILRTKKKSIQTVVYGGSGVNSNAVGRAPHAGNKFIAVKIGIRNLAPATFATNFAASLSITNSEGHVYRPTTIPGQGLDTSVSLKQGQSVFGRVFFSVPHNTRLRKVRFRPFGPKGKLTIFAVRG
jgi:hypothetical protein